VVVSFEIPIKRLVLVEGVSEDDFHKVYHDLVKEWTGVLSVRKCSTEVTLRDTLVTIVDFGECEFQDIRISICRRIIATCIWQVCKSGELTITQTQVCYEQPLI